MAQALLDKHLISPKKQEVVDKLLSTMANCIILTVQTEETTVKCMIVEGMMHYGANSNA